MKNRSEKGINMKRQIVIYTLSVLLTAITVFTCTKIYDEIKLGDALILTASTQYFGKIVSIVEETETSVVYEVAPVEKTELTKDYYTFDQTVHITVMYDNAVIQPGAKISFKIEDYNTLTVKDISMILE